MKIISLVCANARIQKIYIYEQYKRELTYRYTRMYKYEKYKRALTSLQRENSRGTQGAWKDGAPKVSWRSTLPLRYSGQQLGESIRS